MLTLLRNLVNPFYSTIIKHTILQTVTNLESTTGCNSHLRFCWCWTFNVGWPESRQNKICKLLYCSVQDLSIQLVRGGALHQMLQVFRYGIIHTAVDSHSWQTVNRGYQLSLLDYEYQCQNLTVTFCVMNFKQNINMVIPLNS